jgi:hypothetical protein
MDHHDDNRVLPNGRAMAEKVVHNDNSRHFSHHYYLERLRFSTITTYSKNEKNGIGNNGDMK